MMTYENQPNTKSKYLILIANTELGSMELSQLELGTDCKELAYNASHVRLSH